MDTKLYILTGNIDCYLEQACPARRGSVRSTSQRSEKAKRLVEDLIARAAESDEMVEQSEKLEKNLTSFWVRIMSRQFDKSKI